MALVDFTAALGVSGSLDTLWLLELGSFQSRFVCSVDLRSSRQMRGVPDKQQIHGLHTPGHASKEAQCRFGATISDRKRGRRGTL